MANETSNEQAFMESSAATNAERKETRTAKTKGKGIISRIWNGLFRIRNNDFEKRLQHISKEEASVLARMNTRSLRSRRMARHLIIFSVIFEIIAVGYAIITTRSMDLNWKTRAFRILPMFLLPALSSISYSALISFIRMRDQKDQKTLERLRAERQAKIDELKEKTNYYITQQLIQRYDPDPAAKAAAATVLASKLGADSGLKVYVGDESKPSVPKGKSNDVEFVKSSGIRNRNQLHTRSSNTGSTVLRHSTEEMPTNQGAEVPGIPDHRQPIVVEHHHKGSTTYDGGWIARIAALLVGEDPTQSYALICGNCYMHNGLARKEDFPYITYYCPHCHALNRLKQTEEHVSGSNSCYMASAIVSSSAVMNDGGGSACDTVPASSSIGKAAGDMAVGSESIGS
ncbi:uncharacterized protein At2g24330-like [Malania oleifera]|uniref:uncharacterized protein At2g24330-like n=1 Tax=Malania oleifera TaxID=397392 RepID=UPI0025AE8B95|nr:uncharacterized protein At2g24330-like [Malania oleifera]XP_057971997.1 uncharacterized protein At2g24330-like [Malania oleifera]XP_057971998.1 uncharacterized protein At2g24330-like [Malania oleifera]